jgi:hypothetical protein
MAEKVRIPPAISTFPVFYSEVHTKMRELTSVAFQGEINVDQAHRGYDVTVDETGKTWYNPF